MQIGQKMLIIDDQQLVTVFNTGFATISWCSEKQSCVALSSTEAEYAAAKMVTQDCVWLRRLLGDIYNEVEYTVEIRCDNESAIKLAENPTYHAHTKHIEVQHHFVRENVLDQEVCLESVRSEDQVVDIFTKAFAKAKFENFRNALGVIGCEHALRGNGKN